MGGGRYFKSSNLRSTLNFMGCDIHSYVYHRQGKGPLNTFLCMELNLGRDYGLFGLMAGVRGEHKLFDARGFPEDTPHRIRFDYDRRIDDVHDASWLTTGELKQVAEKYIEINERRNPWLETVIGYMDALDDWCQEDDPGGQAILIFFFDC